LDFVNALSRQTAIPARGAVILAAVILPLLFCAAGRIAVAQEGSPTAAKDASHPPPPPRVKLGEVPATTGSSVMVPLYFTPDPKTPIRSFTLEIEHVSNNLEFQSTGDGVVEGLEISSSVAKGKPDDKGVMRSKLRLTLALADKKSTKGIPEGLVAFLMFQLSKDAKPFVIKLTPTVFSAEDTQIPARKVAKLGVEAGSVAVESSDVEPGMTCFFFSH